MTEMMEPDGYLQLTLKKSPWRDSLPPDVNGDIILKIPFAEMQSWRIETHGVFIRHPSETKETMLIPWHNVLLVEVRHNSDKYVNWHQAQFPTKAEDFDG
jgi:hypothetical protein